MMCMMRMIRIMHMPILEEEQSIGIAHDALHGYVAHMAAQSKKVKRVPLLLDDEEIKAVDDWRSANKITSRNEALRLLIKLALKTEGEKAK